MSFDNIFLFLKKLQENNDRTWFQTHKEEYSEARRTFEEFLTQFIGVLAKSDPMWEGLSPKQCMFRIYRDLRFSKDKTPYKTNFGAVITPEGRKSFYAGLYLHLEPGNSFVGSGIYAPDSQILKAIRRKIFQEPERFQKIIKTPNFPPLYERGKLKRIPKGFPRDFPQAELLKYKHYVASIPLQDAFWEQKNVIAELLKYYNFFLPFNAFLNEAVREHLREKHRKKEF